MEITTLIENLTYLQGTKGEHGLSFLVEAGGKRILFDAGQSDLLIANARALGVDLGAIDAVVISHGHYDHTGGLSSFFEINAHATVYLKPGCFDEKFSTKGGPHYIGIEEGVKQAFQNRFVSVHDETELAPGLRVIPKIGQYYSFEQVSPVMQVKFNNQLVPDQFDDELFMVYDHPEGSTVFAGCAHRGIGNICRTAMEVTGNDKVKMVLGGTHLKGASKGRISKTIEAFRDLEVERYALGHCTGLLAFFAFSQAFGEKVRYTHVSTRFFPYD